jgi:hypothetical protein
VARGDRKCFAFINWCSAIFNRVALVTKLECSVNVDVSEFVRLYTLSQLPLGTKKLKGPKAIRNPQPLKPAWNASKNPSAYGGGYSDSISIGSPKRKSVFISRYFTCASEKHHVVPRDATY